MIKIYTDNYFLEPKFRTKIFPVLLDMYFLNNSEILKYYKIVDELKDANIAIFPIEYSYALLKYRQNVNIFIKKVKKMDIPIWIYTGGDFGYSVYDKQIYNFRLSGFKSKLSENTITIPSFITDPYKRIINKEFYPISKMDVPIIGFVGHANAGFFKLFIELINFMRINIKRTIFNLYKDYQSFYPSGVKRFKILKKLKSNKKIKTNFILRKKYRAGVKSKIKRYQTTLEFYNNIYNNPYIFCMRGVGNFSVRFYETIAVGRIPVLIDTDCSLPLSETINWESHALIIDSKNENIVDKLLINFHNKICKKDFINMQINNRLLWEKKLKRVSFFIEIHNRFSSLTSCK